ncbi:MAG TPA: Sua5/YciO/YrdC/YwlC family protein, partial [Polyangiaceae bacterium]|nr:Sua5/YciO/YrdC/YwlC family protein [Polyangiaceae bacterium]
LLQRGLILGIQGLGAFHLACDAANEQAVLRLRERKRRDQQPFALMVANLAEARRFAELSPPLEAALVSPARPIVLAQERAGVLPRAVNGPSRRTGILLPYTALHHALLAQFSGPLVMTSGNPSGGPAIIDRSEATEKLGGIVDAFLFHERPIARRVEDSVVAECHVGTRVVRRARGFAPLPIRLPAAAPEPVLAVGGHLKNSACLVVEDLAYLTPHLGDLELEESERAWRRDLESFERLLGVRAQVIAHDLHPDYASTRFALARPARRRIGVQHHVAHVLSAIAELRLTEPVLGVVFDGSGFGLDGTSWGAEFLVVDGARCTRVNSFRALPLPGGERAVREVWRVALAALREAFGNARALELAQRLPAFEQVSAASLATVLRMLETGVGTVPARGIGRWYDAVGALVLGLSRASFEAHVAIALEEAAEPLEGVTGYPATLPSALAEAEPLGSAHEVDLRPMLVALVEDLLGGAPRARVAARFQRTLVDVTAEVAGRVLGATGVSRVVLSGGSFQNRALERALSERLGARTVAMAREVPVNDGGLALGQAWAAVLALKAERERRQE